MKRTNVARKVLITETNRSRLQHLLESARKFLRRDAKHLEQLEEELETAEIVTPEQMPQGRVVMNSQVRVTDLDAGKQSAFTVVFPRDANYSDSKISILAPIGAALLGYRVGEVVEPSVPGGRRRFRVEQVIYPVHDEKRAA